MLPTIQICKADSFKDVRGAILRKQADQQLGINTGKIKPTKVFAINYPLTEKAVTAFANECLKDVITDQVFINHFLEDSQYQSFIAIAKLPGVTDDEGISAQMALADFTNTQIDLNTQHIFSQEIFYIENYLSENQLQTIAKKLMGNPLIHHISVFSLAQKKSALRNLYIPFVELKVDQTTQHIDLNIPNEALLQLSKDMILALNLEEMQAIKNYFNRADIITHRAAQNLDARPTDCELEILAQTWSEHCKHKEFSAIVHFENLDTGQTKTINSIFKTFIKGATDIVQKNLQSNDNQWLIKVFSDNAGVVQATKDLLFVWKVETHNSPSALDPYGGAITGILGCNRDAMGTGVGGAKLFFNTNVLCFGPPNYSKDLLTGQLHPKQIMEGVIKGIEDGGNKSGIPTVNGAILFDDRYAGKPLVYCGTGGLMPNQYAGKDAWKKPIDTGDFIVIAGGRVGKDGIHGATFSSVELDEHSPQSAVQIGSPITQKKLADFMTKAAESGLLKSSTDNGAGGLSSSVGELAETTNGAIVHLEKVPLKYAGLKPWEIFISESQERMTLVVEPQKVGDLFRLAQKMEVEVSHIGVFTNSGFLDVRFDNQCIAYIDMDFLHNGVPQKKMMAEWKTPETNTHYSDQLNSLDLNKITQQLLADYNIRSREQVIRQYDHEVQGKSIIKPLMGQGRAPQDAAVLRFDFDSYEGIAVSNGINPKFSHL
ncbi:MAG TPA: phosphoribosylformylglycinamidine synthase, partial [Saprospiraceae bacterium]|nr:phosphoribosylformylglycinamidine synthase [Saprospiraceae bacterium]